MASYTDFSDSGDSGATSGQAQRGQRIEIQSLATGDIIHFKAFLTSFSDSFSTKFESEEIYGRMDPIKTFKQTTREISVAFDLPAGSADEAESNLKKLAALARSLYPVYGGAGTQAMRAPPIFKVKFMNLIQNTKTGQGLVVTIQGFDFKPEVENGFFISASGDSMSPKLVKLDLKMEVIHTHSLGSDTTGKFRGPSQFPFRVPKAVQGTTANSGADKTTTEKTPKKAVQKAKGKKITNP